MKIGSILEEPLKVNGVKDKDERRRRVKVILSAGKPEKEYRDKKCTSK